MSRPRSAAGRHCLEEHGVDGVVVFQVKRICSHTRRIKPPFKNPGSCTSEAVCSNFHMVSHVGTRFPCSHVTISTQNAYNRFLNRVLGLPRQLRAALVSNSSGIACEHLVRRNIAPFCYRREIRAANSTATRECWSTLFTCGVVKNVAAAGCRLPLVAAVHASGVRNSKCRSDSGCTLARPLRLVLPLHGARSGRVCQHNQPAFPCAPTLQPSAAVGRPRHGCEWGSRRWR